MESITSKIIPQKPMPASEVGGPRKTQAESDKLKYWGTYGAKCLNELKRVQYSPNAGCTWARFSKYGISVMHAVKSGIKMIQESRARSLETVRKDNFL